MTHPEPAESHEGGSGHPLRSAGLHTTECEVRLFEYLDGTLVPSTAAALEAHLTLCPKCQALAQQWQQLDDELNQCLSRPALSAGFSERLQYRLDQEPAPGPKPSTTQAEIAKTLGLELCWDEYRKEVLRQQLPAVLDYVGYGALAAIVACLVLRLAPDSFGALAQRSPTSPPAWLLVTAACAAAAAVLLAALGLTFRKKVGRWLNAF